MPRDPAATDWTSVEGWLSPAEGGALRRLAAGAAVLELGSWLGRSTCALASAARIVVAVDTFRGDRETGPRDCHGEFLDNLARLGVADKVLPLVGRIEDVGPILADAAFDLVFIDSAHDAASAERDGRLALRCVKPGGVIAWHDAHYQSVVDGLMRAGIDAAEPDYLVDTLAWSRIP